MVSLFAGISQKMPLRRCWMNGGLWCVHLMLPCKRLLPTSNCSCLLPFLLSSTRKASGEWRGMSEGTVSVADASSYLYGMTRGHQQNGWMVAFNSTFGRNSRQILSAFFCCKSNLRELWYLFSNSVPQSKAQSIQRSKLNGVKRASVCCDWRSSLRSRYR